MFPKKMFSKESRNICNDKLKKFILKIKARGSLSAIYFIIKCCKYYEISFYENSNFCLNSNIILENSGPSAW